MKGNSKTVNKIAKYLRQEVTNNSLRPGMHLSESTIAKKFKISRVPVREAFRILQSEGYFYVIPNKGCFVKKISLEFVRETSTVYRLLAPVVLEKAIPKYNERTYLRAEAIICKIEKSKDINHVGYFLWDFARLIYSPSNMKYMVSIFDEIYQHSIRLLNEFFRDKENATFKVTAHREFITLCRQKRGDEAIALWSEFIDNMTNLILKK